MNEERAKKVEAIKYGDVFDVYGELAAKPIAPQDAAAVLSAEKLVLGESHKAGVASVMKAAAEENERRGLVGEGDITEAVREEGAVISETTIVGHRIICESIGGQVGWRFLPFSFSIFNSRQP